jgi:hypothetical protein
MKKDWRGIAIQFGIPLWLIRQLAPDYLDLLLDAQLQNKLDEVTDRQVRRVLLSVRARRAITPYTELFRFLWEISLGKYWRAAKKVHSGSDQASGSGSGAGAAPITQFAYAAAGFTGTGSPSSTGAGPGVAVPGPQPFEDAGIKAGEVKAYRCWDLHGDGFLHSCVYSDYIWKPGEIAEGDPSKPHEGVYAFKSVLLLNNYGSIEKGTVTGTVDLWGEVYEHADGYRAQYAAISSIDESPYYDAKAIRKRYGLTKKRKKK